MSLLVKRRRKKRRRPAGGKSCAYFAVRTCVAALPSRTTCLKRWEQPSPLKRGDRSDFQGETFKSERTPPQGFSQVFILKGDKVLCFDTLLQVFILKVLSWPLGFMRWLCWAHATRPYFSR